MGAAAVRAPVAEAVIKTKGKDTNNKRTPTASKTRRAPHNYKNSSTALLSITKIWSLARTWRPNSKTVESITDSNLKAEAGSDKRTTWEITL